MFTQTQEAAQGASENRVLGGHRCVSEREGTGWTELCNDQLHVSDCPLVRGECCIWACSTHWSGEMCARNFCLSIGRDQDVRLRVVTR